MKKLFLLLMCVSLLLCSCETNQNGGTPQESVSDTVTDTRFSIPADEEMIVYTRSEESEDGVSVRITVHGYRSESEGLDFYAKSNEYFLIDVEVTNGSSKPIYYFLPRHCNEDTIPHNHEIGFDLSCGEYDLHSSSTGFIIERTSASTDHVRTLESGETHSWQLKLAAGEISADDFDLPADGSDCSAGVKLYNEVFYTFFDNGSCTFDGHFEFVYCTRINGGSTSFWIPLSLEVVYAL